MIEEWNVQDASIVGDEIVEIDPFLLVDELVHHEDLLFAGSQASLLLELANIWEDVHLLLVKLLVVLIVGTCTHQVPMDLQLEL